MLCVAVAGCNDLPRAAGDLGSAMQEASAQMLASSGILFAWD